MDSTDSNSPAPNVTGGADRPTLLMQGGPNSGETIALSTSHTTLGRHSENEVVFDEPLASRRHAVIMETGGGFSIRDLGSTNGTYLNDQRIGEDDQSIENGDVIRLRGGGITAVFTEGGGRTMRLSTVGPPVTDVVVDANRAEELEKSRVAYLVNFLQRTASSMFGQKPAAAHG